MKVQKGKINEQGFTIVELMIAMAMSLVVMGAIYSLFQTQQKSYIHQERVATVQQNLRAAMFMLEREIRMAGCNPTGAVSPAPGFTITGDSTIQVTMDITGSGTGDPDGDILDANENITYTLAGTDLTRNGQVVAEYIDLLTFEPKDEDGNGTFESVLVTIVAKTQSDALGTASRSLTSNIKMRNLDL